MSEPSAIAVTAEQTLELRGSVLRPGQPRERNLYPLDHAPDAGHFAVLGGADGLSLAVGSIFRESREPGQVLGSWRIRGMATDPDFRGRGYGAAVLRALIDHARRHTVQGTDSADVDQEPGGEIWCNGRTTVEGFYRRFGFEPVGDVFDLPGLGPHLVMVRPLDIPTSGRSPSPR